MNKVGRGVFKLTQLGHKVYNLGTQKAAEKAIFPENSRSVVCTTKVLSRLNDDAVKDVIRTKVPVGLNYKCHCGCNICYDQTRGEKKLDEFLQEEIKIQIKRQNITGVPVFEDFELENTGSQVILKRCFHTENLTIKVNLNHSKEDELDFETFEETSTRFTKANPVILWSLILALLLCDHGRNHLNYREIVWTPTANFTIELQKGTKTLLFFGTSHLSVGDNFPYDVPYYIKHFCIYETKFLKSTYLLSEESGLDGYLHKLLVFMLEERGINNRFVEKLLQYCAVYEHVLYIDILEKLKSFVSVKQT